jgi:predicted TIM-barrel fold metal-dependent hydrolase
MGDQEMTQEGSNERLMVVTSDGHAGLPTEKYVDYLPSEFHEELAAYCARRDEAFKAGITLGSNRKGFAIWKQQFVDDFKEEPLVDEPGPTGGWDFEVRAKEQAADGIAGEVIFPGPVNMFIETSIPFQGPAFFGDAFTAESSFASMWAGARAYNRWLAERIDPRTQAALALVPTMSDLEEVDREINWAAENGFKGMYLRQAEAGLPPIGDQRYEPVWAACQDHDLMVNFHGGVGHPGNELPMRAVNGCSGGGIETAFWGVRPLWIMIPAGIFDRFPQLRVAFTEVHATWAPTFVDMLDVRYEDPWLLDHGKLERRPSEVWAHNFGIGASFMSRAEAEMRHEIGIDVLMWGSDYPHVEGVWPASMKYMHEIFAGLPIEDVRKLAGENAIRFYNLDPDAVRAAADICGPLEQDIVGGSPDPAGFYSEDRHIARAARPSSWVIGGVPRGFTKSS